MSDRLRVGYDIYPCQHTLYRSRLVRGDLHSHLCQQRLIAAQRKQHLSINGFPAITNRVLERAFPLAVEKLTDLLIRGTALGWNPRKTAEVARRDGLSSGLNHFLLVARDQQIRAYREASRDTYQASSVVYGYKRLATKNKRTCLACLALDGKIYETSELMPLHPQDRCTMIPLVKGFPAPTWETGSEWFASLPEKDQKKMMGAERFDLYQNGVPFEDMVTVVKNDVWGPSAKVTPLYQLRK